MRAHARGTRFKRTFVVCFHCERSSSKVSGELLPGKSFPTSHPSTITAGETILKPALGILESFGIIYSRHYNAYRVVRHNQALGWPATKSYLSSRRRMLRSSTCQAFSRDESTPHFSALVQVTLKPQGYITLNVTYLPYNLACIG